MFRDRRVGSWFIPLFMTRNYNPVIIDLWSTHSTAQIAEKIGRSNSCVLRRAKRLGLTRTKEQNEAFRIKALTGRTTFTITEDRFLELNYMQMGVKTMANILKRSHCGVKGRMDRLGFIQPSELIHKIKKNNQYQKGQIPHNKGIKLPPEIYEKAKHTMYKKGNVPHQTKENGYISYRVERLKSGKIKMYKFIRVSKCKWKPLHAYLWEQNNGVIPKGHIVIFKDGESLNCDIQNLELITRAENMKRNFVYRWPV